MQHRPHVVAVWELGAGYGHIDRVHSIARHLISAGYNFSFIARDLAAVQNCTGGVDYPVLQAPYVHPRKQLTRQLVCLADVLFLQGYTQATVLQGQQAGWQALLDLCKPDLLILDHAPSALLASHGRDLPRIVAGNSFTMPAAGQALTDWRPLDHQDQLVGTSEQQVLDCINDHLQSKGQEPVRWLADLYAAQAHLISSFPQLDLQNQFRESTSYHSSGAGAVHACLDFLAVHPKTLLCYLHQAYKPLDILLQALASLQASSMNVVLVCPGLVPAAVEKLRQAGIAASSETVNLEQAMASCDWFLGHGGIGTLTQAMRLGKPTILMPMHLEQLHNALQVQKAGLGQVIPEQQQAQAYLKLLSSITARTELIQQASAFAAANRQYSEPRLEVAIREQVEAILR